MTIERKVKYVASDGTEHDSPQEAAECNLEDELYRLLERAWPSISTHALEEQTANLARNPEALRDAVNAYFEALEEHADVDDGDHAAPACGDSQCWHRKPQPLGNPNDPSTWRADLPFGVPNYCKPFGVPNYCKPFGVDRE